MVYVIIYSDLHIGILFLFMFYELTLTVCISTRSDSFNYFSSNYNIQCTVKYLWCIMYQCIIPTLMFKWCLLKNNKHGPASYIWLYTLNTIKDMFERSIFNGHAFLEIKKYQLYTSLKSLYIYIFYSVLVKLLNRCVLPSTKSLYINAVKIALFF